MPRPKKVTDEEILDIALRLIHEREPSALTFAVMARETKLSGATLVQRFGTKEDMVQKALLHAWQQLEQRTEDLARTAAKSAQGAVELLLALTGALGTVESHADGLQVLREDFRNPVLRARGVAWTRHLSSVLEECFAGEEKAPSGIGHMLMTQWQGALVLWGFTEDVPSETYMRDCLSGFVSAYMS